MSESKSAANSGIDLAQIERTLQVSIKLMKRGRREIERLRQKSDQQGRAEHAEAAN